MYENPKLLLDPSASIEAGQFTWRSPSNLAIIKYWGKYGIQLPRNPSLSLTLAASCTDTMLEYELIENTSGQIDLDFFFHQEENEAFRSKTLTFLESLLPIFPFLKQQVKILSRLKINNIDEEYSIYIEKIDGYILVVAGK
jgi:diphosphomevalonate decarboxylase